MSEHSAKYNYTNDCPVCGREYHGDHAIEAAERCIDDGHYEGRNTVYVYHGGVSYGDRVTVIRVTDNNAPAPLIVEHPFVYIFGIIVTYFMVRVISGQ